MTERWSNEHKRLFLAAALLHNKIVNGDDYNERHMHVFLAQILKVGRARDLTVVLVEKNLTCPCFDEAYEMNEEISRSFAFRDPTVPIDSQY